MYEFIANGLRHGTMTYMGERIELKSSDGFKLTAYLAPAKGRQQGGIVLLQDAFGLNAPLRKLADAYAERGYDVIAPALFDRLERDLQLPYNAAGIARGSGLVTHLGFESPIRDVEAAAGRLKGRRPVALVGYAWGGSLAYLAASQVRNIACAVSYYGAEVLDLLSEKPAVPLMLHFGIRDKSITKGNVDLMRYNLPRAAVHSYPAGHGFCCTERSTYDAASATQAFEHTVSFIDRHVAGAAARAAG